MAKDGYKPNEIVKALFERNIPTPAEYKAAHGFNGHDISRCCGIWSTSSNEVPFDKLTVNLPLVLEKWYSFIDTNNLSDDVLKWLADNKLANPTGKYARSGYCTYPLYWFDPKALQKYDPDGCAKYSERYGELRSKSLE